MSFPGGLEHLRRCTGSTRWWSVDCGIYANRGTLALFISLGRFRLIGTYNQFFYTPQSSQSHSYLLRYSIPIRNCRLVSLFQAFIPTSGIQTPMASTCLSSLTLLTLHYDYHLPFLFGATGQIMLSLEYNSPRTRHDLYTPTLLFFPQSPSFFPSHLGELCTIHSCSLRCFSSFITPPCIASRCVLAAAPLITFIQPLHLDQVTTSLSWLYLNAFSSGPSLIGYPAVPSFLLASPIVPVFFLIPFSLSIFFFILLLILLPAPSAIFYPLFTNRLRRQKSNAMTSFFLA